MTRPKAKFRERFLAEQAAIRLGKTWNIGPDREAPDFLVSDDAQQFDLEVSEIFAGRLTQAGSEMKRTESETQRKINELRNLYETLDDTPLSVQFIGNMSSDNLATVVDALVGERFPFKKLGHHVVIDGGNGLRVHVTRALRSDWFCVNDRVGWVNRNPTNRIADAVRRKSRDLARYRQAAGSDVRLLLVADRFSNSGKLSLEKPISLDRRGFDVVYFFSYPETITVFD